MTGQKQGKQRSPDSPGPWNGPCPELGRLLRFEFSIQGSARVTNRDVSGKGGGVALKNRISSWGAMFYHTHCHGSCLRYRTLKHGSRGKESIWNHWAVQDAGIQGLRMEGVLQGLLGGLPRVCLGGPLGKWPDGVLCWLSAAGRLPCPSIPFPEVQPELQGCTNTTRQWMISSFLWHAPC